MDDRDNAHLAAALEELAALLAARKVDRFRVRAYERAAAMVRSLPVAVATLPPAELPRLEGVGPALAAIISEFVATGAIGRLEQLRAEEPAGVGALLRLPLIGLRDARLLAGTHGIAAIADLEAAVADEERRAAIGERLADRAAEALRRLRDRETGLPMTLARHHGEALAAQFADLPAATGVQVAGDVRRGRETSVTQTLVVESPQPEVTAAGIATHPHVLEVLSTDEQLTNVVTTGGRRAQLWTAGPQDAGAVLLAATGSPAHLSGLSAHLAAAGSELRPSGVWKSGRRVAGATEEEVYAAGGLPLIVPELREGNGEVAGAAQGRLPALIRRSDLQGDLHVHTDWSRDGKASMDEMLAAAVAAGHRYVALTDHAENLTINGMPREKVLARREAIAAARTRFPDLVILDAAELNIGLDGGVDYDLDFLLGFDFTVASIHSHMDRPVAVQTERILRAIAHPAVDVIGHPTGRILGHRPGYDIDIGAIAEAAAETGTALEVNGSPRRLDLSADMVRAAIRAGAALALSSDAHSTPELRSLDNALTVAQRGWAQAADVLNARSADALLARAARKRAGRDATTR